MLGWGDGLPAKEGGAKSHSFPVANSHPQQRTGGTAHARLSRPERATASEARQGAPALLGLVAAPAVVRVRVADPEQRPERRGGPHGSDGRAGGRSRVWG